MADSDRPNGEKKAEGLRGMAENAADKLPGGVGDAADGLTDKLSGAAGLATGAAGAAAGKLSGLGGSAGDAVSGAAGVAGDKLTGAAGVATGAAGAAAGKLTGAAGAATGAAGAATDRLSGMAGSAGGKLAAGATGAGALASSKGGKGGWRSFIPPNKNGKSPWKLRWLGVPLILGACMLTGWWGWGNMESGLNERALAHLACDGVDTSQLDLDWSYRSVTVDGQLPTGVTADQVERIIDNGSSDAACLQSAGIDANDNPGVYNIAVPAAAAAIAAVVPDAAPDPTPVPAPTATAVPEPTATPEPEPTAEPDAAPQLAALAASAIYDGEQITLTGEVASEEQRAALFAAAVAAVGEANVIDQLTIADGDPSDTSDVRIQELSAAIAAFGGPNVVSGQASIDDQALSYDLVSPTDQAASALDLAGDGTIQVPEAPDPEPEPESPEPSFTG